MATAEPLNHAESQERARKPARLARDTPEGWRGGGEGGRGGPGEPRRDAAGLLRTGERARDRLETTATDLYVNG